MIRLFPSALLFLVFVCANGFPVTAYGTNELPPAADEVLNCPATYTVSGGGSYCAGYPNSLTLDLSGSEVGVTYEVYAGGALMGVINGTGAPISYPNQGYSGSITVTARHNVSGCTAPMNGAATFTSIAGTMPMDYSLTGSASYCAGSTGAPIGLSSAEAGASYQLRLNGVDVGSPVTGIGPGMPVAFGNFTGLGTYTVFATSATGCFRELSNSLNVTTILPAPTVFNVGGGGAYCAGYNNSVGLSLSNSESNVMYTIYLNGVSTGSGFYGNDAAMSLPNQGYSGAVTISAIYSGSGCVATMNGSATFTPIAGNMPGDYTLTGNASYCVGAGGTPIGLNGSEPGASYQLRLNGVDIGSPISGSASYQPISFGTFTSQGTYTVFATSATGCFKELSTPLTVAALPTPAIATISGGGSYCAGYSNGLILELSSSEVGVSYQIYQDGVFQRTISGTGTPLSHPNQGYAGNITVVAIDNSSGCTTPMNGTATFTPIAGIMPIDFGMTGNTSYCAGSAGTPIGLNSAETGTLYQLRLDGVNVGSPVAGVGPGTPVAFGNFTGLGTYTVFATSATGCFKEFSSSINVTTVLPSPAIANVSGGGAYCAGYNNTISLDLSYAESNVMYTIYLNGISTGSGFYGSDAPVSLPNQGYSGTVTIAAIYNGSSCTATMNGSATFSPIAGNMPGEYPLTGNASYCAGTSGTLIGLNGSEPGANYQLRLNGVDVGSPISGNASYQPVSFGNFTGLGTYTVFATSPTGCFRELSTSLAVNTILPLPPGYTVTGGGDYCTGGTGVAVGLGSSDAGINYQLMHQPWPGGVNVGAAYQAQGSPVAGTGAAISFGNQPSHGNYYVQATNSTTGCTTSMPNMVGVGVNPLPAAYTVTGGGDYCAGGTGVAVGLGNSDAGFSYQLMHQPWPGGVNVGAAFQPQGSPVAGTGSAISFGNQLSHGNYYVQATNNTTGCTNGSANMVGVGVNPLPVAYPVTGGGAYCSGGSGVVVGLGASQSNISYQLKLNGNDLYPPMAGTGGALSWGNQTAAGTYTVVATNTLTGCVATMSGNAVVSILPLPTPYTVTGGGTYCANGNGVGIGLNQSEVGVYYVLYYGASFVEGMTGTGAAFTFNNQVNTGSYTVIATDGNGCAATMTGTATIGTTPLPISYTITGGGSYCPGSSGLELGLNSSQTGINYQLQWNGSNVGSPVAGTGNSIGFGPQTAFGSYEVVATNSTTGCSLSFSATTISHVLAQHPITGTSYAACPSPIGLASSQAGISYQLMLNGNASPAAAVMGTGNAITFATVGAAGTYTVVGTDPGSGCTRVMPGNVINTVNTTLFVDASVAASGAGISWATAYQTLSEALTLLHQSPPSCAMDIYVAAGTYKPTQKPYSNGVELATADPRDVCFHIPDNCTLHGGYPAGGGTPNPTLTPTKLSGDTGVPGNTADNAYHVVVGVGSIGITLNGFTISGGQATTFGSITVNGIAIDRAAGGGVCLYQGNNTLSNCLIENNIAYRGGGIYAANATCNILNGTIQSNTVYHHGGGIYFTGTNSTIEHNIINLNTSLYHTNGSTGPFGGGAMLLSGGTHNILRNSIVYNFSVSYGGAITTEYTTLLLQSNVMTFNNANHSGGTIYAISSALTATNNTICNNIANPSYGGYIGGLYLDECNSTLRNNIFWGNIHGPLYLPIPELYTVGGTLYAYSNVLQMSAAYSGLATAQSGNSFQVAPALINIDDPDGLDNIWATADDGLRLAPCNPLFDAGTPATVGSLDILGNPRLAFNGLDLGAYESPLDYHIPATYNVTGGGTFCLGGAGLPIGLNSSELGVNYQLRINGNNTGLPIAGTGFPIDFGNQTAQGTCSVIATSTFGCASTMLNSVILAQSLAQYTATGGVRCPGAGSASINLPNSEVGVGYQLYHNGIATDYMMGTGSSLAFGGQTLPGVYTLSASRDGCTTPMLGSVELQTMGAGNALYVDASMPASGDGISWASACKTLGVALQMAHQCGGINAIHVASGTYQPTGFPFNAGQEMPTNNPRDRTFHLPDGIQLYGGYPTGGGTRNPVANPTMLSGEGDNAASSADNLYHVVLATGTTGVTIDGFTIQAGNANGSSYITTGASNIYRSNGGGVVLSGGTNTIANNTFTGNAANSGAGILADAGNNTFANNRFTNNASSFRGGGVYILNGTTICNGNTFISNSATSDGGGLFSLGEALTLNHNIFASNTAAIGGGEASYYGNIVANNNLFSQNTATSGGGYYCHTTPTTLTNNTFYANAAQTGGGLYTYVAPITLKNSIFGENTATGNAGIAYADMIRVGGSYTASNNLFQLPVASYSVANGTDFSTNVANIFAANPLFVNSSDPDGADNIWRTADDGLQLRCASPAVAAGTNTGTTATDIVGNLRTRFGTADMGAYESMMHTTTLPTTPPSAASLVRVADAECEDGTGWTHYFASATNDRLLSLKKNGNNIGSLGDGTFAVHSNTTANWGSSNGTMITAAPYVNNPSGWYVMNRWWKVTATTQPTTDVQVRSYFTPQDIADLNGSIPGSDIGKTQLKFYKINGAGADPNPANGHTGIGLASAYNQPGYWEYNNGPIAGAQHWRLDSLTTGQYYAEYAVASFSGGGGGGAENGGNSNSAFPVEWLSFEATPDAGKVELHWVTASEINNDFFLVERSVDGVAFVAIGEVQSLGNSSSPAAYRYTDLQAPAGGYLYYRIRQTDLNGAFSHSETRTVLLSAKGSLTAWPNPAYDVLNIACSPAIQKVYLSDVAGQVLWSQALENQSSLRLDLTGLAAGVYMLYTNDGQKFRIIKE